MLDALGDIKKIHMEIRELQKCIVDMEVDGINQGMTKKAVQDKLNECSMELHRCWNLIQKEFGKKDTKSHKLK